jgi:hypothetical protein
MNVIAEVLKSFAPWILAFNVGTVWMWFAIASALYLSGRMPKLAGKPRRRRRGSKK